MIGGLSEFHLLRPIWLLSVVPAFLLWLAEQRRSDGARQWRRVIDSSLLIYLLVEGETRWRLTPRHLLLAAWIVAVVVAAGPSWQREPSPFADAKPPVVVVLRVSRSMQATDLAPTRLDRARQKLSDILAQREGASTGLVAYDGSAHLVLPPTPDSQLVLTMAQALSPDVMPREGDDLAGALSVAANLLSDSSRNGAILILTDDVAASQLARLQQTQDPTRPTTIILGLVPRARIDADGILRRAATALDARLVPTTVDQSDVADVVARLDRAGAVRDITAGGERWQDAGYWLLPILTVLTLLTFRRGWVLS